MNNGGMSITMKLNLEADEAIEKLKKIKETLQEIIELNKAINNNSYRYYRHEDGSVSTCPEIKIDV